MRSRILSLLLLLLVAALSACSDSKPLRLTFQSGDEATWRFTLDQKIMQAFQGQQMQIGQLTSIDMHQRVDSVDAAGVGYLLITYKAVRTQMQMPTGAFSFDSENPPAEANPYTQMMMGMVDLQFNAEITPTNDVRSVSGVDAALDRMMQNSGLADNPDAVLLRENMAGIFGEEAITYTLQQMRVQFPDKALSKGDTWDVVDTMQTSMRLIAATTYTVTDINDELVVLGVASSLQSITESTQSVEGDMTFSYNVAGTQSGGVNIVLPNGVKQDAELFQDLTGTMSMQSAAFGSETPIEVPTQMNTRLIVESI
jgi:hypothetical protein